MSEERQLEELRITPLKGRRVRFRLRFRGKRQPIEFELTFSEAMSLLGALRRFQAIHRLPIPQLRPSGKPKLSVVKDDE